MGREQELAELRRLIEGRRPVVVFGEAGVGKTVFVREAAALSDRRLAEAGALATLSWMPYLPLRRLLGRAPTGDEAYVAAEVERAAGDALVFFDDVQWADRETRAVIPFLAGRLPVVGAVRRGDPSAAAVLDGLSAAGFELLPLEPLGDAAAAELLELLRPGLAPTAIRRLVERTGGNPLLLEELATSGEPTESLQLALAARLRTLSDGGRGAMGLLALAGHPLESVALGAGGAELVDSGLAARENGTLAVRHSLVAEAAAAGLLEAERRALHLRLAELLGDSGEVARHYASAGDRELAFAHAMRAVEQAVTPGERALHFELAALCAAGAEADQLRIDAADALAEAELNDQAVAVLDQVRSNEPPVLAKRHLYRSRASLARRDLECARTECEAGLALVAGSGAEIESRLALEDAQLAQTRALSFDLELPIARDKAVRALDLARGSADHEALARRLVGSIGLFTQDPGWDAEFLRALELGRRQERSDVEFSVAASFDFALRISGRLDEAVGVCREAIARAQLRRFTVWERRLRESLAGDHWHRGDLRAALEELESLAAEAGPQEQPDFYLCQVLADLGRHDESLALARKIVEQGLPTWHNLGDALWALSDAELAAGNPRGALEAADELLERFGDRGPTAFVQMTRGWARHDLGLLPDRTTLDPGQPMVEGAPVELRGLALLAEQRFAEAAVSFHEAAGLWEGRHFRGYLRCRWAEGEALRLDGDAHAAVAALERAEALAAEHEWVTLLRRIRRSLRLAGVRRSARRGISGELTLREREVLGLVGDGISNAEIARRLGIGMPTVERLVRSASRKLGARTRAQAAALGSSE